MYFDGPWGSVSKLTGSVNFNFGNQALIYEQQEGDSTCARECGHDHGGHASESRAGRRPAGVTARAREVCVLRSLHCAACVTDRPRPAQFKAGRTDADGRASDFLSPSCSDCLVRPPTRPPSSLLGSSPSSSFPLVGAASSILTHSLSRFPSRLLQHMLTTAG